MKRCSAIAMVLLASFTARVASADTKPVPMSAAADGSGAPSAKSLVSKAKDQGLVGEQADGYLGFVRGEAQADADVQAAVAEINAGRARLYRELASRRGVDPAVVGAASFEIRFDDIPSGRHYRDAAGTWRVK